MINQTISENLRMLAARNGVRVEAPFELTLTDGSRALCEAYFPDFGGPNGAVCLCFGSTDELWGRYEGFWSSILGETYETGDDETLREMLDDWGWFGPADQAPAWYTGQPWGAERDRPRT